MKSWPFEQASLLLKHVVKKNVAKEHVGAALKLAQAGDIDALLRAVPALKTYEVRLQTGFGPSGAPHIGTFGEVIRTDMVRRAFQEITQGQIATRIIAFSDDYDGFRRVPDGMPETMKDFIGLALTRVPDPEDKYPSFAHRNNAALVRFIQEMDVEFTFMSSTDTYERGDFNHRLAKVFRAYDDIQAIMLPTLREERRATYSPFMPVTERGEVLQVPIRLDPGYWDLINFDHPAMLDVWGGGEPRWSETYGIFDGNVKLQWKPDWAMRWAALGIDFEMHGKDLIDSATAASAICKVLGGTPPVTYFYELFLAEDGTKISKSKGNGLGVDDWLEYGTPESLRYYMCQTPRQAKELSATVIPRVSDELLKELATAGETKEPRDLKAWHVYGGAMPSFASDVSYNLLVNLASVANATTPDVLMGMLQQYRSIREEDRPLVEAMVPKVAAYVRDRVLPNKRNRPATAEEAEAMLKLAAALQDVPETAAAEDFQFWVYEVGKAAFGAEALRGWFQSLYEVLFGSSDGPRFGTFVAAYGRDKSIALLQRAAAVGRD